MFGEKKPSAKATNSKPLPSSYDKHDSDLGIAKDEREPNYVQNYGGEKFVHTQNGRIGFFSSVP